MTKKKTPAKKGVGRPKGTRPPDGPKGKTFTARAAEKVLAQDLANIVKKSEAGQVLTREERAMLLEASDGASITGIYEADNYTHLAELLGITTKTLQKYREMDGSPRPQTNGNHNVSEWRLFVRNVIGREIPGDETPVDPDDERLPLEPILKRRKLMLFCAEKEIVLAQKRGELIEIALVRETWMRKCAEANAHLRKRLENELPAELEGLTAADIYDALVRVVDEFNEIMSRDEREGGP